MKQTLGALVLGLTLVGCATPTPVARPAAVAAVATGQVKFDVRGLPAGWIAGRALLAFRPEPGTYASPYDAVTTKVRIAHAVPGAAPVVLDTVPAEALATTTVSLPEGVNRVVTLEALNAGNDVLATLRAVVTVSAASPATARFDALSGVVARVFDGIRSESGAARDALLASGTAAADVRAALDEALFQYDVEHDAYTGDVDPYHFRAVRFAKAAIAASATDKTGFLAVVAADRAQLSRPSLVDLVVTLTGDPVGNLSVLTPSPVSIYNPDFDGPTQHTLRSLPPGTWTVVWRGQGELTLPVVTASVTVPEDVDGEAPTPLSLGLAVPQAQ